MVDNEAAADERSVSERSVSERSPAPRGSTQPAAEPHTAGRATGEGVRQPRDGRDSRWEQHREERREALVDATIRAIRKHGATVGMDDIALEAGTSKTVVYRHF